MPELRAQPACPCCGGRRRQVVGQRAEAPIPALLAGTAPGAIVDVARCRDCGHYYCDPLPLPSHLADLYADASSYFASAVDDRLLGTGRLIDRVEGLLGRGNGCILDVGAGEGALLEAAEHKGWTAVGLEPTESFADVARGRGLDIRVGYLDDAFTPDAPFDAVAVLAVLEHVPDPLDLLRQARRVMVEGGVLIAEVPNGRRPEAWLVERALRLRRHPWSVRTAPLQSPFHLSEFTTRSLTTVLARAGFEVITLDALPGTVPYPVPRWIAPIIRAVERTGDRFGSGLNLLVAARAVTTF